MVGGGSDVIVYVLGTLLTACTTGYHHQHHHYTCFQPGSGVAHKQTKSTLVQDKQVTTRPYVTTTAPACLCRKLYKGNDRWSARGGG
jgi:hypothetical protein